MTAKETYKVWLKNVRPEEANQMLSMNEDEIIDAFSAPLAFGTAGMRGTVGAGTFRMNVYTVRQATAGVAEFLTSLGNDAKKRGVVISYDTRRFSKEFARAVAEVLAGYEINAYIYEDVRPVPMCSFAIRELNASAGIMITASHNPKEYNGYKLYGDDGAQMSPQDTAKVVEYIRAIQSPFNVKYKQFPDVNISRLDNTQIAPFITVIGESIDKKYYDIIEKLALSIDDVKKYGEDLRLVYTPVHGAGYRPVVTILNKLGIHATLVNEQAEPDTEFSTVAVPNPENASTLKLGTELAERIHADVVIGTDPDCDRMGVAVKDKNGEFMQLTGNQIGVLLLDYVCGRLKESGKMPKGASAVRSFVSTTLADRIASDYGVEMFVVPTGFKFIGEKIKEWEVDNSHTYVFGFEESFGSLRGTHARDKDAVVATMLFAEMVCYLKGQNKTVCDRLNEIFEKYGTYTEINTTVQYKGFDAMEKMSRSMDAMRREKITTLGGKKVVFVADYLTGVRKFSDGRTEPTGIEKNNTLMYGFENGQFVCVRPSGTEPKLKLYSLAIANDKEKSKELAKNMIADTQKLLD